MFSHVDCSSKSGGWFIGRQCYRSIGVGSALLRKLYCVIELLEREILSTSFVCCVCVVFCLWRGYRLGVDMLRPTTLVDLGNSAVPKELRANMSCYYQPSEQHLLAFDGDLPLATDEVHEFTPGSLLTFRCADIGKYALIGSGSRTCEYGEWTGVKSSCIGLSQEHDYARKSPAK